MIDDEIGGWAVATANVPTSQLNSCDRVVVWEGYTEGIARHVSGLHNEWLEDMAPPLCDLPHQWRDGGHGCDPQSDPDNWMCWCGRPRWDSLHRSAGVST